MMLDAVLRDFGHLDDVQILTTCDQRLQAPKQAHHVLIVDVDQDVWALWQQCIASVDAVLIIAPETGGALEKLTHLAERLNKPVLGSAASAVKLAGDKWLSYQCFVAHGIPTLTSYLAYDLPADMHGAFVAKPRDGAGCDDMRYFADALSLKDWLPSRQHSHIVQPYQNGEAVSISLLCKHGQAYLLSGNRQYIKLEDQHFSYHGGLVNGMAHYAPALTQLAQKIAQAMPDLAGYVGVDLLIHQDAFFVIEVNPRLTTSYVALHQACGCNPAQLLLDLFYNDAFTMPVIAHHKVEISLHA